MINHNWGLVATCFQALCKDYSLNFREKIYIFLRKAILHISTADQTYHAVNPCLFINTLELIAMLWNCPALSVILLLLFSWILLSLSVYFLISQALCISACFYHLLLFLQRVSHTSSWLENKSLLSKTLRECLTMRVSVPSIFLQQETRGDQISFQFVILSHSKNRET